MKYLSAKQIAQQFDFSMKTARTLINEMRAEIEYGRYSELTILDGCGVRVSEDALIDYIHNRKMLKNPVARKYVAEYDTTFTATVERIEPTYDVTCENGKPIVRRI